jgi:5-methylcytosine-specific restriction enzyme subunit McrC
MQTDITLTIGERTLIIDTKYYSKPMQENYGKPSLHSAHLYQIHTYVTSEDSAHIGKVDGLLLYAMTSDTVQPKYQGTMPDGNIIMAQSLNLNQDFQAIKQQLETLTSYAVL